MRKVRGVRAVDAEVFEPMDIRDPGVAIPEPDGVPQRVIGMGERGRGEFSGLRAVVAEGRRGGSGGVKGGQFVGGGGEDGGGGGDGGCRGGGGVGDGGERGG